MPGIVCDMRFPVILATYVEDNQQFTTTPGAGFMSKKD